MGVCGRCSLLVGAVAAVPVAVILAALSEAPTVTPFDWQNVSAEAPATKTAVAPKDGTGSEAPVFGSGKMFDKIAFAYDVGNRWMSLGLDQFWRQTMIEDCLQLMPGDKVLDLATGTADVALLVGARLKQLAAQTADGAAVYGVDPSTEMLRHGVQKVRESGMDNVIHLHQGDAQDLSSVTSVMGEPTVLGALKEIPSDSIDKVTMSFGIRNVPNRDKALQEMVRVLRKKPESTVCILELSLPDGSSFLSKLAQAFIKKLVPLIGKVATFGKGGDEYLYLERSIVEFPAPKDFAAQMTRNGLPVHNVTAFGFGSVQLFTAKLAI